MKITNMNDLYKKISSGLHSDELILDVREPSEYNEGHIPGSRNIPLKELPLFLEELRQHQTLYIHCQAGGRAQHANEFLKSSGLTNLVCVSDGGFGNWKSLGYPIEKS